MAWIIDKQPPISLELTPSLTFNNLTSNISSLAYIHKGSVVICGLDGKGRRTLDNDGDRRAIQVLLCSGGDFDFLVVALNTGVQVWSTDGQRLMYYFDAKGPRGGSGSRHSVSWQSTQGIAVEPNGHKFVVGCSDGDVFAFEAKSGPKGEACELTATLKGHQYAVTCAGADTDFFATGDASGTILLWSTAKHLARDSSFKGDGYPATAVCTQAGNVVASYSTGHIRIFDARQRTLVVQIAGHSRIINAIDLHPSSMLLVTVGEDTYLNVWELPGNGRQNRPDQHIGLLASSCIPNRLLTGAQFLHDGSHRIMATAYDGTSAYTWHKL